MLCSGNLGGQEMGREKVEFLVNSKTVGIWLKVFLWYRRFLGR